MKVTYKYTDKIWKKEVGPCDPDHLGRAWFKNRITKDSSVLIVELDKRVPLWTIPDFKAVEEVRRREWTKLAVAGAILLPVVCAIAWWLGSTGESPDMEKERRAEEWLSDPTNRAYYNEYMREQRNQDSEP